MEQAGMGSADSSGILVIGVGNPERGDDGVGLVIARSLAAKNLPNATVVQSRGDGARLQETWKGINNVIIVDAVSSGAPPGTIHRLEAHAETLPRSYFGSSHSFGVAEAIELARTLQQLPARVTVYGIEGKSFELGMGLSHEVVSAARQVVASISKEVRAARPRQPRARPRTPKQIALE